MFKVDVGEDDSVAEAVTVVVDTWDAEEGVMLFNTYFSLCKYRFLIFCHGNLLKIRNKKNCSHNSKY